MSEFEGLSGKARGEEYARRMDAYLKRTAELPLLNGSLNVKAIAEAAGIPTQSVYKNPTVRELIDAAKQRLGVQSWAENRRQPEEAEPVAAEPVAQSDTKTQRLEKRLAALEQRNSALMAENFELRRQLKELRLQLGREDMVIETGRRIVAPASE
jgi:hypothetical protein